MRHLVRTEYYKNRLEVETLISIGNLCFVLYQWSGYSDVIEFDQFRTINIYA